MKKYVGLWLDHRETFVVYLINNQPLTGGSQETIERIESDIERRVRLAGGYAAQSHLTGRRKFRWTAKRRTA